MAFNKLHELLQFFLKLAKKDFKIKLKDFSENELKMLLMIHYDVWQSAAGFNSLEESINQIGENKVLVKEIIEVLEILSDRVDFKEIEVKLPYNQPLKVHARYTRDQILAAFGDSSFDKKSSNREGVAFIENINSELLFVDLLKSEEDYSPTTMYDDYAISEILFHWQSQNQTRDDLGKGLTYINHEKLGKRILLFVREQSKNQFNNTMGYVFIGEAKFKNYEGSKPMSIKWELHEPIPNYLWKESAKMSVG